MNQDTQGDMRALQLENARLARLLEEAQRAQREGAEAAALQERLSQVWHLSDVEALCLSAVVLSAIRHPTPTAATM